MNWFTRLFLCLQGGTKIELGANWIHGILGNPLYELAVSNNLVDVAEVSLINKKYYMQGIKGDHLT